MSSGSTVYANQFDYSTTQGLLKSATMGNGAVESYGYNSRLQMKSIDLTKSGTQLQHYDYKYGVYDPAFNNCVHAFTVGINAIREDLNKQYQMKIPISYARTPQQTAQYINNYLRPFVKGTFRFPYHLR